MQGSLTALITPMKGGTVDEAALRALVDWQLREGTDGLVPCGTTGEGGVLEPDEWSLVVRATVEETKGRVPVLAGCGTYSTHHTIENVRRAKALGATHALVVAPYYNRPPQEGLFAHFRAAARDGGLPIVLYNIPSRTGVDVSAETTARLFKDLGPLLAGVKEATGLIARTLELLELTDGDLAVFAGDDALTVPVVSLGGRGVITTAGNCAPAEMSRLVDLALAGDFTGAARQARRLNPLLRALFVETNPVPLKAAMQLLGRAGPEIRLPLVPAQEATVKRLREALGALGLL